MMWLLRSLLNQIIVILIATYISFLEKLKRNIRETSKITQMVFCNLLKLKNQSSFHVESMFFPKLEEKIKKKKKEKYSCRIMIFGVSRKTLKFG
jgi:hypothetical protein